MSVTEDKRMVPHGWQPSRHERELQEVMDRRRKDWRFGHVIYQVIVDRFVPSARLDTKRAEYSEPRRLMSWDDLPSRGRYLHDVHITEGQLEFWGGDLESLQTKIEYLKELGIDVVYLNPIFWAFSNHKYDGNDYFRVDPQYGDAAELKALANDIHDKGMRLILDGVFNHVGRRSPLFQTALNDPDSKEAGFFYIGDEYRNGHRGWRNGANLPELNLENPEVRDLVHNGEQSAVRYYLRDVGIDGWRLDVAPDIGPAFLAEITDAAHETREDSVVIGECWNWPEEWLHCLDGVMNMHLRELLLALVQGRLSARRFNETLGRMLSECDTEGLLRSHVVLDNHDTPRLPHSVPDGPLRRLLKLLQFTLPGCPVVYYGSEVDMSGGPDPENRAPMRWDLVDDSNTELRFVRDLIRLRDNNPALRFGDCRTIDGDQLVAFLRMTDRAAESLIIVVNVHPQEVEELVQVRHSRLMDAAPLECLLTGERISMHSGTATLKVPGRSARVFRSIDRGSGPDYSMFKRVL